MKVAVITPYYQESKSFLQRCIKSVAQQTCQADHFMISDGYPQEWLDIEKVTHIRLDQSHGNFGNTPRCIGGMLAISRSYDAITFLDADNWFDEDHIEECLKIVQKHSNIDYVVARRRFVRADGSELAWPEEPVDQLVDTNCFFLLSSCFHMIQLWGLTPTPLTMYCDRVFLAGLQNARCNFKATNRVTVNYLCTWKNVYEKLGEPAPEFAKELDESKFISWINSLTAEGHELISRRLNFSIDAQIKNHGYKFSPIPRVRK